MKRTIQFVYSGRSQVTLDQGFKHHTIWINSAVSKFLVPQNRVIFIEDINGFVGDSDQITETSPANIKDW